MRVSARFAVLTSLLALGACATRAPSSDATVVATLKPHSGYRTGQAFERASLPAGSLIAEGETPLQALVEWDRGGRATLRPVAAQEANLTVAFVQRDAEGSGIDLKNASGRSLKFDLYVSRDGQSFTYAESCPAGAEAGAFAHWPHRIQAVAIANPRVVETQLCD